MIATENQVHAAIAQYLSLRPNVAWFHVPNGGSRHPFEATRLKRMGVKRGVPDILIISPFLGAIELKRERGGRLAPEQREWLDALQAAGFRIAVARGIDDALGKLKEWGI